MESLLQTKSRDFAIRIIKCYNYLVAEKHELVMSKQLLRCGTSIGANTRESKNAQSRMDFLNKLNIALKEADEPTNEASAEAKFIWTMPCKEEEDEVKPNIGSTSYMKQSIWMIRCITLLTRIV